jgi:hypothetical protein
MESIPDGQWLTYGEAAARLGVSIDAIRRRACRGHWARLPGNDGKARIRLPDDLPALRLDAARDDAPTLVRALEAHIATLKADNETLKGQLGAERERADHAIAEFVEIAKRLATIAEVKAELEPPRHWAIRAWRWMQKTA